MTLNLIRCGKSNNKLERVEREREKGFKGFKHMGKEAVVF